MNDEFARSLNRLLCQIVELEKKINSYRELLNEQIQFNLKDLYTEVCGNSPIANAYHFRDFVANSQKNHPQDLTVFESIVKSYNNCTSMKYVFFLSSLSFIEFSLIFLNRENKLLAKIVLQRNSLGSIPLYLLNYAKKILLFQYELHEKLISFRKSFSALAENWVENLTIEHENGGIINELLFEGFCNQNEIDFDCLMKHLKLPPLKKLQKKRMQTFFTLKNSQNVGKFLAKTSAMKMSRKLSNQRLPADPFIRPEFHDCLERPKVLDCFSRRQIKSIEKHLDRMKNQKQELPLKINKYREFIEKQLKVVCQAIKQIIWLQKQLQYERIELCLCTDFYPVLFFECFDKDRNNLIIPSSMKDFLQTFGIKMQLNHIFALFKRYSKNDGKLDFNDFCSIFDVCKTAYSRIEKNRKVKTLEDVQLQTKKHFLRLLRLIIKNELNVQKIKKKLMKNHQINLRDIFGCLDTDEDGWISILDLRISWKKYLLLDLPEEQAELLWFRMGLQKNSMLKYEKFIYQMCPKTSLREKGV